MIATKSGFVILHMIAQLRAAKNLPCLGGFSFTVDSPKELLGLDNFASLIVPAVGAHMMGKANLAALRAGGTRGGVDTVMNATTTMSTDTTRPLLGYCHGKLLLCTSR